LKRKPSSPLVLPGKRAAFRRAEFSTLHDARAAYERDFILKKLDENHGNVSERRNCWGWNAATFTGK